jgi:hypothetical protein
MLGVGVVVARCKGLGSAEVVVGVGVVVARPKGLGSAAVVFGVGAVVARHDGRWIAGAGRLGDIMDLTRHVDWSEA